VRAPIFFSLPPKSKSCSVLLTVDGIDGCSASIFGRRQKVITESAERLSKETGSKCIGVSGDVRKLETIEEAVKKTVKEFGKIDYVICGYVPRRP